MHTRDGTHALLRLLQIDEVDFVGKTSNMCDEGRNIASTELFICYAACDEEGRRDRIRSCVPSYCTT